MRRGGGLPLTTGILHVPHFGNGRRRGRTVVGHVRVRLFKVVGAARRRRRRLVARFVVFVRAQRRVDLTGRREPRVVTSSSAVSPGCSIRTTVTQRVRFQRLTA